MKFFLPINRIYNCFIYSCAIVLFVIFCVSCEKQETIIGYKIPENSYFISINNDKGIIYFNGKCTKYLIDKTDPVPEVSLTIEDSVVYAHENFSKFVEDNSDFIRNASVNLFIYDGEPTLFFDLQVIAKQLDIFNNTRFSNLNQIVGFYGSVLNQGNTIVEVGKYRITYEYADSVCDIVKLENIVSKDVLYSNPLIISNDYSDVKPIIIQPNELETQLIKSAFLIKSSPYLLLSKLYFGCWKFQSDNNTLQEVLTPFAALPNEWQLGKIDRLSTSLIFGKESNINDAFSINNRIVFTGMVEVPLYGIVDDTSVYEYIVYDETPVEEFSCTQFPRVSIDADSHIVILNESNQIINLVDLLDIDPQYEIVDKTLIIDRDFFEKLVLVVFLYVVLSLFFIFIDKLIKNVFRALIIKTLSGALIHIFRLIYIIIYGVLVIIYFGLTAFFWVDLIGMQTLSPGLIFILFSYLAITFFPVSIRSKVPSDKFALLLRGFKNDDYKSSLLLLWSQNFAFEMGLTRRVHSIINKFYAIGMTKELFSPWGAKRIYAKDSDWKEIVTQLIQKSSLIIIDFHESESCIFEINRCNDYKSKTICVARNFKSYSALIKQIGMELPEIPDDGNSYFFRMGENKIYPYQDSEEFLIMIKNVCK